MLINLLEVAAEEDEGFILAWERARDFLSAQDGYRFDESSCDYWFLDALDLVGARQRQAGADAILGNRRGADATGAVLSASVRL